MRKLIYAPLTSIVLILLIISANNFQQLCDFMLWLIQLDLTSPDVSIASQIVIKGLTFSITLAAVGAIFEALNWFDSEVMSFCYVVISIILSFVFCHVFHFIEANILWIGIGCAVLVAVGATWWIIAQIRRTR